jgi:hypothetical protein
MSRDITVERMTGIEPAYSAWEADVLPLNYIREEAQLYPDHRSFAGVHMVEQIASPSEWSGSRGDSAGPLAKPIWSSSERF